MKENSINDCNFLDTVIFVKNGCFDDRPRALYDLREVFKF